MMVVSTPKAMQQLRRSVAEAQEHAGLAWWNLLLTQKSEASAMAFAKPNPCPKTPAREATYADSLASRSSAWPIASARQKADARQGKARPATEAPSAVASPELASNNNHASDKDSTLDLVSTSAEKATDEVAQALPAPEQPAAPVAAPQIKRATQAATRILRALAALDRQPESYAPASLRVVGDLDQSEFASSPEAINALLDAFGKKGVNVQFKMRKMPERNQLPRVRGRLLISRDINIFTLQPSANLESIAESE
jgi:hypothetical protein